MASKGLPPSPTVQCIGPPVAFPRSAASTVQSLAPTHNQPGSFTAQSVASTHDELGSRRYCVGLQASRQQLRSEWVDAMEHSLSEPATPAANSLSEATAQRRKTDGMRWDERAWDRAKLSARVLLQLMMILLTGSTFCLQLLTFSVVPLMWTPGDGGPVGDFQSIWHHTAGHILASLWTTSLAIPFSLFRISEATLWLALPVLLFAEGIALLRRHLFFAGGALGAAAYSQGNGSITNFALISAIPVFNFVWLTYCLIGMEFRSPRASRIVSLFVATAAYGYATYMFAHWDMTTLRHLGGPWWIRPVVSKFFRGVFWYALFLGRESFPATVKESMARFMGLALAPCDLFAAAGSRNGKELAFFLFCDWSLVIAVCLWQLTYDFGIAEVRPYRERQHGRESSRRRKDWTDAHGPVTRGLHSIFESLTQHFYTRPPNSWPTGEVGDMLWGRFLLINKTSCQSGTTLGCIVCCAVLSALPGPRVAALDLYVPQGTRSFLFLGLLAGSDLLQDALLWQAIIHERLIPSRRRLISHPMKDFVSQRAYPQIFRSHRTFVSFMLPVWASGAAMIGFTTRVIDSQVYAELAKNLTR